MNLHMFVCVYRCVYVSIIGVCVDKTVGLQVRRVSTNYQKAPITSESSLLELFSLNYNWNYTKLTSNFGNFLKNTHFTI